MSSKTTDDIREKRDDRRFVRKILRGDKRAWAQFVDQYTDWVYYRANKWTGRGCQYREELHDAYLWIMEQVRKKLKFYTGKRGATLSTYVWWILESRGLFADFLRWKYGDPRKIPKILQEATEEEKKVFVQLRMRKEIEQIASGIDVPMEEAEVLVRRVIERLISVGLEDLVSPQVVIRLNDALMNTPPASTELTIEDRISLREAYVAFCNAVSQLESEEQRLLRLFYNVGLNPREILEEYRLTKMNLPGGRSPSAVKPKEVYGILRVVREKLMGLLRETYRHDQEVNINERAVKMLLEIVGVLDADSVEVQERLPR